MHKSDQQITQPHTTQASSQIFPAKFFIFLYANIVTTPHSSVKILAKRLNADDISYRHDRTLLAKAIDELVGELDYE